MGRIRTHYVPCVPYVPALGVAACVVLVFSLGPPAWVRFGAYTILCAGFYVARGLTLDSRIREDSGGCEVDGVLAVGAGDEGTEMTSLRTAAARDEEDGAEGGEGERAGLLVAGAATSDRRG